MIRDSGLLFGPLCIFMEVMSWREVSAIIKWQRREHCFRHKSYSFLLRRFKLYVCMFFFFGLIWICTIVCMSDVNIGPLQGGQKVSHYRIVKIVLKPAKWANFLVRLKCQLR